MQTFGLHTMLLTSLTNLTKWIQHFFGHEALICTNRVVRAWKGNEMIKRGLKASNTIVIRFLGIALDAWINAAFSFLKKHQPLFPPPPLAPCLPRGPAPSPSIQGQN